MFSTRIPIVAGLILTAACVETAAAAEPGFDCAKANSAVEKLICGDAQLAELDRETARLFNLAKGGARITPAQREELASLQEDWIKKREECGTSHDPRQCLVDTMVARIVRFRQSYPDVRQQDGEGISLGPFAAHCEGFRGRIDVSYVNSHPAFAYLAETSGAFVLRQATSGSGARYEATLSAGKVEVWTKGSGAQITLPGHPEMTCALDAPK